jgi:transposase
VSQAEDAYREAIALYKRLTVDFPAVTRYRAELALTLSNLAADLLTRHEPVAARALLEEAVPHSEAALKTNPRHPFYRTVSRDIAENRAEAFLQLGNHGIKQDEAAVAAAITEPWSNGPVEGQINRLKLIKRQMFGRASFELLRLRVLHRG